MNEKNHHFSIRLPLSSQTTGKRKYGVAFLHSQLFTLGGFGITYPRSMIEGLHAGARQYQTKAIRDCLSSGSTD